MNNASSLNTELTAAIQRYIASNPKSEAHFGDAKSALPGGNTRTVLYYSPFPLTFARGDGAFLHDLDGHSYVDLLGGFSAGIFGHSHPIIIEAAKEALDRGIILGGPNPSEIGLARQLTARFPSCELVRFCNSGTEANLMAISTARAVTGRDAVLVFDGAYHGGVLNFARGESATNIPLPVIVAPYNDIEETRRLIRENAQRLAAILVEPMMGAAGAIVSVDGFLESLRPEADRAGALLVFDEVITSRLSPGGLQGTLSVKPDLTTFGKYIGGGFSFGAFGGPRRIMERFDPARPDRWSHAGTFNNNVMSMSAGFAALSRIYTPEVAVSHNRRGDSLRERLNGILQKTHVEAQITGMGSILNLHFQRTPIRRPADIQPAAEKRTLFQLAMLERGFYLSRRGFITLSLVLSADDLDRFAKEFESFFVKYHHVLE